MDDVRLQTALIAGAVAIVTAVISSLATLAVARRREAREFKLEYQVEAIVSKLLNHPKWRLRTFKTISFHVAGFSDTELRQILLRVGALRFEDASGEEIWGLFHRVQDLLNAEYGTKEN